MYFIIHLSEHSQKSLDQSLNSRLVFRLSPWVDYRLWFSHWQELHFAPEKLLFCQKVAHVSMESQPSSAGKDWLLTESKWNTLQYRHVGLYICLLACLLPLWLTLVNLWILQTFFSCWEEGNLIHCTNQGSFLNEMEMWAGNPEERIAECSNFLESCLKWRNPLFSAIFKRNKAVLVCLCFPACVRGGVSVWSVPEQAALPIQIGNDLPSLGLTLSFTFDSNVTRKYEAGSVCMESNEFLRDSNVFNRKTFQHGAGLQQIVDSFCRDYCC